MSGESDATTKQVGAPNVFYDVIVFLTPTVTFGVGVLLGMHRLKDLDSVLLTDDMGALAAVALALVVFFLSYEFGRIAETYSDVFVATPVRFLQKHKVLMFCNADFGKDLSRQVELLGIPSALFDGRANSKWTLLFYALDRAPPIGADLLKRYAWEKLARSSAFAMFALAVISIMFSARYLLVDGEADPASFTFGSLEYTLSTVLLYVLWTLDYYKRNCWNNDLLITTIPVLIAVQAHNASVRNAEEAGEHP
jgi:hypothetical protein